MRWLTLFVLLLATVAIYGDDEVETSEASGTEEPEEEVDDWENDGIMKLESDDLEDFIEDNEFVLVEFYAPWCGHCKAFAPEYAKLPSALEEMSLPVKVVKVDASNEPKYSEKYGVRGYPTLKLFRNGEHSDFWGDKTVSNIIDWLKKKTSPPAVEIKNVDDAEELINSQNVVVIGFFDDFESEEAKAYLSAADSIDEFKFGISNSQNVYKQYVAGSASIFLFKKFDERKAIFDGEFDKYEIQKFVAINAAPLVIDFKMSQPDLVFSVIRSHVLFLVSKEEGHIQKYIEPAKEAAQHFRGKVVFVAINTDLPEHQRILDFLNVNVETVPTVRLMHAVNGATKKYKPKGNDLSPESIRTFVQDGLDGKLKVEVMSEKLPEDWDKTPVKTLVGSNFDDVAFDANKDVFVAFYSPWSEESKALTPIFDELGEKYKDSETVIIARFDAASNELDPDHPKIDSFPTLRLYKKGDNDVAYYVGKKSVDAFVKFIESGGEDITPDDVKESEDEDESTIEVKLEDVDKSDGEDKSEDVDITEDVDVDEDDYNYEEERDEL